MNKLVFPSFLCAALSLSAQAAGTQEVTLHVEASSDSNKLVHLSYHERAEKLTNGLGLRLHFNSNALSLVSLQSNFKQGQLGTSSECTPDEKDLDRDPSTDCYATIAWVGSLPSSLIQ